MLIGILVGGYVFSCWVFLVVQARVLANKGVPFRDLDDWLAGVITSFIWPVLLIGLAIMKATKEAVEYGKDENVYEDVPSESGRRK